MTYNRHNQYWFIEWHFTQFIGCVSVTINSNDYIVKHIIHGGLINRQVKNMKKFKVFETNIQLLPNLYLERSCEPYCNI